MPDSFLIVGLGNPGDKYRDTRHNIGFAVVDVLAARWKATFSKKFKGDWAQVAPPWEGAPTLLLLKPLTYMNLSGESVGEAVRFFKIPPPTHLLVIADDIDLPPGQLRLRLKGGTGGHNGLKSLVEHLSGEDFPRLRLGVGRSSTAPADAHVLMKYSKADKEFYDNVVALAADGVEKCVKEGISKAMNTLNQKPDAQEGDA